LVNAARARGRAAPVGTSGPGGVVTPRGPPAPPPPRRRPQRRRRPTAHSARLSPRAFAPAPLAGGAGRSARPRAALPPRAPPTTSDPPPPPRPRPRPPPRPPGRCTGTAFVVCCTVEQAARAFNTLNKHYLGHRSGGGGGGGGGAAGRPGGERGAAGHPASSHGGALQAAASAPTHPFPRRAVRPPNTVEIFNALPQEVDAAAAGVSEYEQPPPPQRVGSSHASSSDGGGACAPPASGHASPRGTGGAGSSGGGAALPPARPVVRIAGVPAGTAPRTLAEWLLPARCFGGGSRGVHYDLDEVGGGLGAGVLGAVV
jgi:hypothetical protein